MEIALPSQIATKPATPAVEGMAELFARTLKEFTPADSLQALLLAALHIPASGGDMEAMQMKVALRGISAFRELLTAEGGLVSAEELGDRLQVSRETVNSWRQKQKLFGLKRGERNYSYPAWQEFRGAVLPGLESVLQKFAPKKLGETAVFDYLLSPSGELEGRPLDLLRKGEIEKVTEHAARYGDIGA